MIQSQTQPLVGGHCPPYATAQMKVNISGKVSLPYHELHQSVQNKMYKISLIIASLFIPFLFVDSATAAYTKCQNLNSSINRYCFKRGDRGIYIQKLSIALSELGYYQGKPKNLFDKELEKSVIKFQREYRLKSADGIVGNETLLQICKAKGKGCTADASNDCYTGSPRNVVACLNDFKTESEKDRSYSDGR